jgi:hypothetical protein
MPDIAQPSVPSSVPLPTPRQLVQLARDNPIHTGAGFIAIAILMKTAFFIKIIAYGCLTLGAVFIWEAYKATRENREKSIASE